MDKLVKCSIGKMFIGGDNVEQLLDYTKALEKTGIKP